MPTRRTFFIALLLVSIVSLLAAVSLMAAEPAPATYLNASFNRLAGYTFPEINEDDPVKLAALYNAQIPADSKARDGKKTVKRQPPDHNFVNWDKQTFARLMAAPPERLSSRFQVSHAMLLNVLSRPGDGQLGGSEHCGYQRWHHHIQQFRKRGHAGHHHRRHE